MNRNVKRATVVLALTPVMSLPAIAIAAASTGVTTTTSTLSTPLTTVHRTTQQPTASHQASGTTTVTTHQDAPPASASAVAADVAGVITIGSTKTTAGAGGGTAHAHALDLLGTTVAGGDVTNGKQGGDIIATPDNPVGDLEVAPWSGSVEHAGGGTQSQAEAALAHAGLLGVLQIWLLHSQAQSTWTPDASHGHSTSDGAEANLDDQLDVKVLHAETDSNGKGSSALLVINGTGIGTNDQLGASCALNLDPLANILCLQATGGTGKDGTTTAAAYVGNVTGALPGVIVTGVTSGGGHVAAPVVKAPDKAPVSKPAESGPLPHTNGPAAGRLPFTGSEAGLLAAYGALLTGLGAAIARAGRRRRTTAATA